MLEYRSFFKKKWFIAVNKSLYTRTFLSFLVAILMSFYVLSIVNQARADDIRDLDSIEALISKWEEVKKEGLSAGDVKKLTDKLKELAGDDIKGTGVGQLLDSMNANAKRLANLKDAGNKLQNMIALVETYKNLPTGDEFDGEATMKALADTLKYMSDLANDIPPPFGTIAGPMLKAYSKAIGGGAGHIGAIQAATKAKNEAIEGNVPEAPPEDVEESFKWNVYPYRASCPECELEWWMANESAGRASDREGPYKRSKKAADALSEQAKETRDRLVREGYREKTAERMANEQEVLFEGRKRLLIEAWNAFNQDAQRLREEFEKADEHAKKMRPVFIACLEKCNARRSAPVDQMLQKVTNLLTVDMRPTFAPRASKDSGQTCNNPVDFFQNSLIIENTLSCVADLFADTDIGVDDLLEINGSIWPNAQCGSEHTHVAAGTMLVGNIAPGATITIRVLDSVSIDCGTCTSGSGKLRLECAL